MNSQCLIRRRPVIKRHASLLLLTLTLAACGGTSSTTNNLNTPTAQTTTTVPVAVDTTAPTATVSPALATLGKTAPIIVGFSKSMDVATLQLTGTLSANSDGGTWSKTVSDNDTFTLLPRAGGSWTAGSGQTIIVNAKDTAGNAVAPVNATYLVPLMFDNFQAAQAEIGQVDFTGISGNQGGAAGANTLAYPYGNPLVMPEGKLFIGDYNNNRILAFNSLPTTNNASADFVLGQPDLTTTSYAVMQNSHAGPQQIVAAGGKMIVANWRGNRILIYNTIPTSNADRPSVVVGQPDFVSSNNACNAATLFGPETVTVTPQGKLIVTDSSHNRVLIWNTLPTTNGQPADVVLGQADFTHCTYNDDDQNSAADATPSARTMNYPSGIWSDGTKLTVVDNSNNRVLIWNQVPSTSFQPADIVLGQASFTANAPNDDNQDGVADAMASARTMNSPYDGIDSNGTQLAIVDTNNHRVLIWNTFPTTSFQPADIVLGQSNFANKQSNDDDQNGSDDGVASARVFTHPSGVLFYRDKLLVVDTNNNRVLVFKSK